jgi:twinkle protein
LILQLVPDFIDFKQYLLESEGTERVVSAASFVDRVIERLYGEDANNSPVTPWTKIGQSFQMRPGEVTLWAGINGHGKTLVSSHVALHLLVQNEKVCIASFEMKGEATMARMVKQASGTGSPSVDYIKRFHEWTDDLLWIYDQQGVCDPRTLRGVMLYASRELGVTHFFVDSMMKVVKGDDDYNGQKDFVNEICSIAQDTGMHIHLIAHVKKKDDELSLPNKFDVKGSSSVTDLVDNVCIVWRNRVKEKKLADPKATATDFEEARKLPDAVLSWTKQRHYDWEGKLSLWLAPGPQSFTDSYLSRPYTWEPPHVPLRTPALIVTDQGDRDEVHTAGRGEVESGSGTEPGVRIGDRQDQGEVSRIEDHVSQDW